MSFNIFYSRRVRSYVFLLDLCALHGTVINTITETAIYDMLIDFTDTEEIPRWIAINDNVMGGISQSRIVTSH